MESLSREDYKIARKNGITPNAVYKRVYERGWSKERAITEPRKPSLYAQYKDICIVNRRTFCSRVRSGMPPEKAATTPPGPTSPKNYKKSS